MAWIRIRIRMDSELSLDPDPDLVPELGKFKAGSGYGKKSFWIRIAGLVCT